MTERKPAGVNFESWVDKQIREATERGEFNDLPGAGKPLPSRGDQDDELWWIKNYLHREELSTEALLPESLRLRKEIERLRETVRELRSEQAVREIAEDLNGRIAAWLRAPSGPQVRVSPVNVADVLAQWREDHEEWRVRRAAAGPTDDSSTGLERTRRARWWDRIIRRRPRPAENH